MSGFFGRLFGKNEKQIKAQKIIDARAVIRKNEAKLHEQERNLDKYKEELKALDAEIEALAAKRDGLLGAKKEQANQELLVLFKKLNAHKEIGTVILRNIDSLNLMISKGKQLIHGLETDTSTDDIDNLTSELQLLEDDLQEQTIAIRGLEKTSLFKHQEASDEDLDGMLAAYHQANPVTSEVSVVSGGSSSELSLEEQLAQYRRETASPQVDTETVSNPVVES